MTTYPMTSTPTTTTDVVRPRPARQLDQAQYWVGAVLTAAITALVSVLGIVVAQDVLHLPLALGSIGLAGAHLSTYTTLAAVFALLAALGYDGMLAAAPRPFTYYTWLTGLLTVLAVLLPFTVTAALGSQVALAVVNLLVGISIMTLVPIAASNAGSRR